MSFEVDLVYLWVDDTDEEWLKKKNSYLKETTGRDEDAVSDCRFSNNDELKYSLRSVEENAPWINKIFIVTDGQVPSWLNTNHPKIKIVDHSEIIPKEYLPVFNSCAIETRIPFIEGLSEYFLYANDDTFFWNKVTQEFFFKNKKPIYRFSTFFNPKHNYKSLYGSTILRAYNLITKNFKPNFYAFYPHHNIDPYKKSLFLECVETYSNEFKKTLFNRFRSNNDIQRIIVSFYSIVTNNAILKNISQNFMQKILNTPTDSSLYSLKKKHLSKLKNKNTKLMCINDNKKTTSKDREELKKILEIKFNNKSSFER